MAYHGKNRLYRDNATGKVGGVCAGLSECFKIDVTLLRIIFAVLFLGYGTGLLLYFILWIILPDKSNL